MEGRRKEFVRTANRLLERGWTTGEVARAAGYHSSTGLLYILNTEGAVPRKDKLAALLEVVAGENGQDPTALRPVDPKLQPLGVAKQLLEEAAAIVKAEADRTEWAVVSDALHTLAADILDLANPLKKPEDTYERPTYG